MLKYFDREGHSIPPRVWMDLNNNSEYKAVARTRIRGNLVSTVWLGMDHNFGFDGNGPVIFETMVFFSDDFKDEYCERYCTEDQARAGHVRAIAWLTDELEDVSLEEIEGYNPFKEDS